MGRKLDENGIPKIRGEDKRKTTEGGEASRKVDRPFRPDFARRFAALCWVAPSFFPRPSKLQGPGARRKLCGDLAGISFFGLCRNQRPWVHFETKMGKSNFGGQVLICGDLFQWLALCFQWAPPRKDPRKLKPDLQKTKSREAEKSERKWARRPKIPENAEIPEVRKSRSPQDPRKAYAGPQAAWGRCVDGVTASKSIFERSGAGNENKDTNPLGEVPVAISF